MKKFVAGFVVAMGLTIGLAFAANVGSKSDIAGVSAAVVQGDAQKHIREVHVAGDYALVKWYWIPEGNGYQAYKRISGEKWKLIAKGGGEGDLGSPGHNAKTQMLANGVPASIANQLCTGWPAGNTPCSDTD